MLPGSSHPIYTRDPTSPHTSFPLRHHSRRDSLDLVAIVLGVSSRSPSVPRDNASEPGAVMTAVPQASRHYGRPARTFEELLAPVYSRHKWRARRSRGEVWKRVTRVHSDTVSRNGCVLGCDHARRRHLDDSKGPLRDFHRRPYPSPSTLDPGNVASPYILVWWQCRMLHPSRPLGPAGGGPRGGSPCSPRGCGM